MTKFQNNTALVVVDIQNDFCSGGSLAVTGGDEVIPIVNSLVGRFPVVIATQDWHPPNHVSFRERGGPWPPHCVQNTKGADFHRALDRSTIDSILRKGWSPDKDAYSAFEATDDEGDTLNEVLRSRSISTVYIAGLTTDYCVRATALDALANDYRVYVITDAVRAVDVDPGDGAKALDEIVKAGGRLISSAQLLESKGANAK